MDTARPPYAASDVERFLPEPSESVRTPFERDRARIVHSAGLRRLAAKTQVVGPSTDDFTRNRLTHTLEVAQVGRDVAVALGCDPDLVEAACLAHDLGHPPFGHNGERTLAELSFDIGGFEGNAQTFRLLTRLESKTFRPDGPDGRPGQSLGLNLTRGVLDAATKYPWPLEDAPVPAGRHADGLPREGRKFGVYDDDRPLFDWMRGDAPSRRTCIEAQIMDLADDIAYSVHDVEDGIVAGRIDLATLADPGLRAEVWDTVQDWYAPATTTDELEEAFGRLTSLGPWPQAPYDGSRRHLAGLKNLTSRLINRFCSDVQQAVELSGLERPIVRYSGRIMVPWEVATEIALLKGIAAHLVMKADDRVAALNHQRTLIAELVEAIWTGAPETLEPMFRDDFADATDEAARRRVVIDQVASLTDLSAVDRHRALTTGA